MGWRSVAVHPVVRTVAESAEISAGTSHVVTMPSGVESGDLLFVTTGVNEVTAVTFTYPAGWTPRTAGSSRSMQAYRVADGTEGASITITTSASKKSASIAFRITGAGSVLGLGPVEYQTGGAGTSVNPDPPSISPLGGTQDYLFIAFLLQNGEEADDDTWTTAAPASYGDLRQKTSGVGGVASTNVSIATAARALTAATEDPAAFTVAQSLAWQTITIAVYPAVVARPLTFDPIPFIPRGRNL